MIRKNDYKEMEVRISNEWKKVDVLKTLEDGSCLYLMGDKTADGSYIAGAAVPGQSYREIVREPETITVVKSAPEIIQYLIENGYEADEDGDWIAAGKILFLGSMFRYCGKVPNNSFIWEPEWLEEVPVVQPNHVEIMDDEEDEPLFI